MLIYINDKEVEELDNHSNNAIVYIHDSEEYKPNTNYEYIYTEEYDYSYEESDQEDSACYEVEYEVDDFAI